MRRRTTLAGLALVVLAALAAPVAVTAPAIAGSGVGCTGAECSILLAKFITLGGDVGDGSNHVQLSFPQPPCLWEPIGDAISGSNLIISQFGALGPGAPFGVYDSVKQAKKLLKDGGQPAGTWYQLPVNPGAGAAGQQLCDTYPLFTFAVQGQLPQPPPQVPAQTLAEYAYNNMRIPTPTVTINPAAKGYVNLASYVWGANTPSQALGVPNGDYKVTATLGNVEEVTVWAQLTSLSVQPDGPGTAYTAGCGPHGSHYRRGHAPSSAGAGTPPDCGVLWAGPDKAASVTITDTWRVIWGVGDLDGPGPGTRPLPPISLSATYAPPFPVEEIQSINNG